MTQFDDMGEHGTKIIVFNLWFNDDGDMELDFISDEKESCISLYYKEKKEKSPIQSNLFTSPSRQQNVAN